LKQAVLTYWDHYTHKNYTQDETLAFQMEITYVRHLDLVALLEVLRERVDEFFGRNVLNSHSTAVVNEALLHLNP
jgi:hypothetical protein